MEIDLSNQTLILGNKNKSFPFFAEVSVVACNYLYFILLSTDTQCRGYRWGD